MPDPEHGSILVRRGPTADRKTFTPLNGEVIYDTENDQLYIGDSETAGGKPAFGDKIKVDDPRPSAPRPSQASLSQPGRRRRRSRRWRKRRRRRRRRRRGGAANGFGLRGVASPSASVLDSLASLASRAPPRPRADAASPSSSEDMRTTSSSSEEDPRTPASACAHFFYKLLLK